ncbi:MAG: methyltransferase domain-containing protein [Nanoarchaeota archaeon]|mgnify:CR=1 FL=1
MNKQSLLESLKARGFSVLIIKAFEKVKRDDSIPENAKAYAYRDTALSIGEGQTISQPYTIAFMLSLLELDKIKNKKCNILEIGSGSGYVLALLSEMHKKAEIYGLEIKSSLVESSKKLLEKNKKIHIINKSGFLGFPEKAPYDRILISASAQDLEILNPIIKQLSSNGILVSSVQNSIFQIKKYKEKIRVKEHPGFVFVPLVKNNS